MSCVHGLVVMVHAGMVVLPIVSVAVVAVEYNAEDNLFRAIVWPVETDTLVVPADEPLRRISEQAEQFALKTHVETLPVRVMALLVIVVAVRSKVWSVKANESTPLEQGFEDPISVQLVPLHP